MLEWWMVVLMVIGALCVACCSILLIWVGVLQWRLESRRDRP